MNTQKDPNAKEGMRIKLISMVDDPNPIPAGMEGTIILIDDMGVIHVNWDNGRRLGVIYGVDEYILEPALENVFDKISEDDSGKKAVKTAIKKTPSVVNKSMPSTTKMPSDIKGSIKKSGIKTDKVTKNFKSANIPDVKVESEEDITEITGAGGAGGATSSGPYVGPMGATKPTFGAGPLTSTGVAKPGPLHPKKKKKKIKENVFTKADLVKEITNMQDSGIDDTNKESWADKNSDGWRWNDTPLFEEGEIVDPLAKMKTTWDDSHLDISKDWDKVQKLKKEDLLRMVNNRINESKKGVKVDLEKGDEILTGKFKNRKDTVKKIGKNKENQPTVNDKPMLKFKIPKLKEKEVKEEEQPIEEETTFGSVFPGGNFPVVPAFAAQKGQWRTAKKPIWKGGKIVQKVENSGVLNPVNEANTVKYNPQGKIVKIKKKCTKFPYCSQGAVDKPLNLSNTITEPGSYVEEQLMKNVHEVAMMTGKSFQEVYNIIKKSL
jgi:hypothetical protein